MTVLVDQPDYSTKSTEYFQQVRPEMLQYVPAHCRRALDVGCAEGNFGVSLKRTLGLEVWGVEPTEAAAEVAAAKLDRVIEGLFKPEMGLPEKTFDCIFFNDVLEHMPEPELALRYAKSLLAPDGVIVASIPNIRYFPAVYQLMIHAQWEYADSGILDRTHFRFFTRFSIINMFEREGFAIESIRGINVYDGPHNLHRPLWWAFRLANILALNKFDDMRFLQFAVVARPIAKPAEEDSERN